MTSALGKSSAVHSRILAYRLVMARRAANPERERRGFELSIVSRDCALLLEIVS